MAKKRAESNILGRLAVQVTPDLSGFHERVKAYLRAVDRALKLQIGAEFDAVEFERQVDEAFRQTQATLGKIDAEIGVDQKHMVDEAVKSVDVLNDVINQRLADTEYLRTHVRVKVEPDGRSLDEAASRIERELAKRRLGGREPIEIDLTASGASLREFRREVKRLRESVRREKILLDLELDPPRASDVKRLLDEVTEELMRREFGSRKIPFDIDFDASSEELYELRHKLKDLHDDFDGQEIEFKAGLDKTSNQVARARLSWLARDRWVVLKPIVDSRAAAAAAQTLAALAGARLSKDLIVRLWDMVKNLDKAVPLVGALSSGLSVAAASIVTLAKHTLTVGAGLVHAVQAVGLLGPGFAVAGGVLAASFIVPLVKFKDHVGFIKDDFEEMADLMAGGFWESAGYRFSRGYQPVFDALRDGLARTSAAAGRHFGRVVESAGRLLAPLMGRMFAHVEAGIERLGRHSDSLATLLGVLGTHGAYGMERFLSALGRVTDKWAAWLVEADRSGRLGEIIERGVRAMQALGSAASSTYRVFSGLAKAASEIGGANIEQFAAGMKRVADAVNGDAFQRGFKAALTGARRTWDGFVSYLRGSLGNFFHFWAEQWSRQGARMGEAAGRLSRGLLGALSSGSVAEGLGKFFSGLVDGVRELDRRGLWESLSKGLGSLLSVMGSLGRGFAPVIAETLKAVSEVAQSVGPTISRVVESAGPRLAAFIERMSVLLVPLLNVAGRLADALLRIPGAVELVAFAFIGWRQIVGTIELIKGVVGALGALRSALTAANAAAVAFKGGQGLLGAFNAANLAATSASVGKVGTAVAGVGAAASGASGAVASLGTLLANPATWVVAGAALLVGGALWYMNSLSEAAAAAGDKVGEALKRFGDLDWQDSFNAAIDEAMSKLDELGKRGYGDARGEGYKVNVRIELEKGDFETAFKSTMDEIVRIAETDTPRAMAMLEQLGRSVNNNLSTNASRESWRAYMGEVIDSSPNLKHAFGEVAASLSYVNDSTNRATFAMGGFDVAARLAAAEQARLRANSDFVSSALSSQTVTVDGLKLSYEQAASASRVIQEIGPRFLDMSEAVRGANGEAVESIADVVANLKSQAEAHKSWAKNVVAASKEGISEGFLKELSKMPEGSRYLAELVEGLNSPDADVRAHFRQVAEEIKAVYPAAEGMSSGVTEIMTQLSTGLGAAMQGIKDALTTSIDDSLVQQKIRAAASADELVKILSESGYKIAAEGNNWVVTAGGKIVATIDKTKLEAGEGANAVVREVKAALDSGRKPVHDAANNLLSGPRAEMSYMEREARERAERAVSGFSAGIRQGAPAAQSSAAQLSSSARTGAAPVVDWYAELSKRATTQFNQNLAMSQAGSFQGGRGMAVSARSGAHSVVDYLEAAGKTGVQLFVNAIYGGAGDAWGAGSRVGDNAASGVRAHSNWWGVGRDVVIGFVNGIEAYSGWVWDVAWSVGANALNAVKSSLGIHSPSREFKAVGRFSAEGLVLGLDGSAGLVESAASRMARSAVAAFESASGGESAYRRLGLSLGDEYAAGIKASAGGVLGEAERLSAGVAEHLAYKTPVGGARGVDELHGTYGGGAAGREIRPIEIHQHIAVAQVPAASELAASAAEEARMFEEVMF